MEGQCCCDISLSKQRQGREGGGQLLPAGSLLWDKLVTTICTHFQWLFPCPGDVSTSVNSDISTRRSQCRGGSCARLGAAGGSAVPSPPHSGHLGRVAKYKPDNKGNSKESDHEKPIPQQDRASQHSLAERFDPGLLGEAIPACIHFDIWDGVGNVSHHKSSQLCCRMEPSGQRLPQTQASNSWERDTLGLS